LFQLLEPDYLKRPRAAEALSHSYFSEQEPVTQSTISQESQIGLIPQIFRSIVLLEEKAKINNIDYLFDYSEVDLLEVAEEAPFDSPRC
jgi:hypothetical protein